jgi:threonine dehydrogenase-like Zn-dependent dehydrogenase
VFTILPRRLLAGGGYAAQRDGLFRGQWAVGGQGRADLKGLTDAGLGKVVAISDVDPRSIAAAKQFLPDAQVFSDYREMYDKAGKTFDAVLVATPDHWHAIPTLEAMQLGKHVYTEKTVRAHGVGDPHADGGAARKYNVVTHMGNQGTLVRQPRTFKSWVRKGAARRDPRGHTCGPPCA